MKKTFLSWLAVALLLAGSGRVSAQEELQPLVVVSLSSYNELLKDVEYVGQLTGQPQLAASLEQLLGFFTQGQGLAGLDKARPWGAVLSTDGETFPKVAFLPVTDVEKLMASLVAFVGEPQDLGDGVWELTIEGEEQDTPLCVKAENNWAFVAPTPEDLETLPSDPAKLVAELNEKYDLGIRAYLQNIPEQFRQIGIALMQQGLQQHLEQREDETDEEFERRQRFAQQQLDTMITMINDLDELTVGWALDRAEEKMYLDFTTTAVEGSQTAEQIARLSNVKSNFAGFYQPEAPFSFHTVSEFTDDEAEATLAQLQTARDQLLGELEESEEFPDEQSRQEAIALVTELFQVAEGVLQSNRIDLGAQLTGTGPFTLVAGGHVSEDTDLDQILEHVVALFKDEGLITAYERDAEKVGDLSLHRLVFAAPGEEAATLAALFGDAEKLELLVGQSAGRVYLATGPEAVAQLQGAIEASAAQEEEAVLPLRATLALAPILGYVAELDEESPQLDAAAERLKESGRDKIRVVYQPIPNGATTRIEAETGILGLGSAIGTIDRQAAPDDGEEPALPE